MIAKRTSPDLYVDGVGAEDSLKRTIKEAQRKTMTADQFLALPPRERDAVIYEEKTGMRLKSEYDGSAGYEIITNIDTGKEWDDMGINYKPFPHYSDDLGVCVRELMGDCGELYKDDDIPGYIASVGEEKAQHSDPCLAIMLAFAKAHGVITEGGE